MPDAEITQEGRKRESVLQRFNRLQLELKELREEIEIESAKVWYFAENVFENGDWRALQDGGDEHGVSAATVKKGLEALQQQLTDLGEGDAGKVEIITCLC